MQKILLLLVLVQQSLVSKPGEYFRVSKETQEYVENLARFMGIRGRVQTLIDSDETWGCAPEEGYVLIPTHADVVFSKRRLRIKRDAALQRGFLMHELGHLREKNKKQQSMARILYMKSISIEQLRLSREEERAADASLLNDREVLEAMRDFFLQRSGVISLSALEKLTEKELLSQTCITRTHPCDAARALYFHRRLQVLACHKRSMKKKEIDMIKRSLLQVIFFAATVNR